MIEDRGRYSFISNVLPPFYKSARKNTFSACIKLGWWVIGVRLDDLQLSHFPMNAKLFPTVRFLSRFKSGAFTICNGATIPHINRAHSHLALPDTQPTFSLSNANQLLQPTWTKINNSFPFLSRCLHPSNLADHWPEQSQDRHTELF